MKPGDEIPEYVKQRIEKLQRELTEAEAERDAVITATKFKPDFDPLLLDVITALKTAELASDPGRSTPTMDQKVSGSRRPPSPGSHVRKARDAERILRKNLNDAVRRYVTLAEAGFFHERRQAEPKVWCRNSSCEAKNRRVPKYVGPRGESRIEMVFCQKCNGKLSEAT